MDFSEQELERFSRQILADGVGGQGQKLWFASTVTLVGESALLLPCAFYLGRAGVGHIFAPEDVLARVDRNASPRTRWDVERENAGAAGSDPAAIVIVANADVREWHVQVRKRRPLLAALWVAVREARVCVASWAVQRYRECPLDAEFWSSWQEARGAEPPTLEAGGSEASPVPWCSGAMAASLALQGLLRPAAEQAHTWLLEDFATGLVRQRLALESATHAKCPYCAERSV